MAKDEGYIIQQMPGIFVSKTKILLAAAVFVVLIIIIIVLAAVLGHQNAKDRASSASIQDGEITSVAPTTVGPTTAGTEAWWQVRLPKNVVPVHYDIVLRINLTTLRFDGDVSILVNVSQPTDLIMVHTDKMNVTQVDVTTKDGDKRFEMKKHFYFEKNQFYVLMMNSNLEAGQYIVKMKFEAFLGTAMTGLYKSTYRNKAGETVTLAATQFQPTDARRAFPCFDEPALKATFTVTLAHDPNMISISNMPIVKTDVKDGWQYDHFEKTVVMPTYLLAFVVCDFGSKTVTTTSGVKMTYYAPKDQVDQLEYAVNTGKNILEYMEKHFNISYPLPKCDMIAIPDFSAGAMENWGLILYRETFLLYKPNASSETDKQRIADVISHELAHMWFGNLVTMKWWDDLWLNEGFASFVAYLGVNHAHPDWQVMNIFVIESLVPSFSADGLKSSHPLKVPVDHPNQINEIFDTITYSKGASVIRMLRYFLGEHVFDRGLTLRCKLEDDNVIRHPGAVSVQFEVNDILRQSWGQFNKAFTSRYLNEYAYSNAKTDDLWKALHEESCAQGKCVDMKRMMDTWTLQMNYPVLTVTKDGSNFNVAQDRFLFDPEANETLKHKSPFGYKWVVPFTYITAKEPTEAKLKLLDLVTSASFSDDGSKWVKGNVGQTGVYRVNYEDSNWQALKDQLKSNHKVFNISDRAALIDDAFDLARGERLNYTRAMDMTIYLKEEEEYVPWSAAYSGLSSIGSFLPTTSTGYKNLERYEKFQSKTIYEKLGLDDKGDHMEKYLRSTLLDINCGAGEKTCLDKAAELFKKWMDDPEKFQVPSNFRSLVYFYGIKSGGEKEWDFAFEQFLKSTVASERRKLLYGLSATQVPWILSRYLQYSLDESKIKAQDTSIVINNVANHNPGNGQQMAWDFVRLHWDVIRQRYEGGFYAFRSLVSYVTLGFSNEFLLQELIAFKEANKDLVGSRSMDRAIERIKARIQWRKKNEVTVERWLQKFIDENNVPE